MANGQYFEGKTVNIFNEDTMEMFSEWDRGLDFIGKGEKGDTWDFI